MRFKNGYPPLTPVAIVYRVSWPDEKIILGTLEDILERWDGRVISKTALIMVGEVMAKKAGASMLYDKNFSHSYRTLL